MLQQRRKWSQEVPNLKAGDPCLLTDKQLPRSSWPLAVVQSVKVDSDGHVRRVILKAMGHKQLLERHVTGVVLLEASPLTSPNPQVPVSSPNRAPGPPHNASLDILQTTGSMLPESPVDTLEDRDRPLKDKAHKKRGIHRIMSDSSSPPSSATSGIVMVSTSPLRPPPRRAKEAARQRIMESLPKNSRHGVRHEQQ